MVGFDGSDDSRRALGWALLEAQSTGRRVHLLHSHHPCTGAVEDDLAARARRLLDEGLELCREHPDVRVTAEAVAGPSPAASLLAASSAADLLVVGCRGHPAPYGLLAGSVSEHLSRHATCPVVTVRPPHDGTARRVVLGLTVPTTPDGALAVAFEHAASRGVGLTAINVWHGRGESVATGASAVEHYVALDADRRAAALDDVLAPWCAEFPTVSVTTESIVGHAGSVLRDASEHAALLVVGRREKGGIGVLLGSVSQSALHHARCPVAVVGLVARPLRSLSAEPHAARGLRHPAVGWAAVHSDRDPDVP